MTMPFFDLRRITGLSLSKYDWIDVEQLACLEASLEPSTETERANVRLPVILRPMWTEYKVGPY